MLDAGGGVRSSATLTSARQPNHAARLGVRDAPITVEQADMFIYWGHHAFVTDINPDGLGTQAADTAHRSHACVELGAVYPGRGRPSVPPEVLLKASLLMALYSI